MALRCSFYVLKYFALYGSALFVSIDMREAEVLEKRESLAQSVCRLFRGMRIASERYEVAPHIAIKLYKFLIGQKHAVAASDAGGV